MSFTIIVPTLPSSTNPISRCQSGRSKFVPEKPSSTKNAVLWNPFSSAYFCSIRLWQGDAHLCGQLLHAHCCLFHTLHYLRFGLILSVKIPPLKAPLEFSLVVILVLCLPCRLSWFAKLRCKPLNLWSRSRFAYRCVPRAAWHGDSRADVSYFSIFPCLPSKNIDCSRSCGKQPLGWHPRTRSAFLTLLTHII